MFFGWLLLLAFMLTSCNLMHKGKYNLELVLTSKDGSAITENITTVIKDRFESYGIAPSDFEIKVEGELLKLSVKGIDEPERVKGLLLRMGKLDFWETYENEEVSGLLQALNDSLSKEKNKGTDEVSETETVTEAVPDSNDLTTLFQEDEDNEGFDLAVFEKENPLWSKLNLAIYQDQNGMTVFSPGPAVGYVNISDKLAVDEMINEGYAKQIFPRNLKFCWTSKPYDENGEYYQLVALKGRDSEVPTMGDVSLTEARADFGQTGGPEINMRMDEKDGELWATMTDENVGRSIAIVFDGEVYSFPTVNSRIEGGRSAITGNFTLTEAKDMAYLLNSGGLPMQLKIVEEKITENQ